MKQCENMCMNNDCLVTPDSYRRYYTPQTLAEMWGCSKDLVYDLLRLGKLKGFKLGRDWRISDAAVQAYEQDAANSQPLHYTQRYNAAQRGGKCNFRVV